LESDLTHTEEPFSSHAAIVTDQVAG